jgi:hypothetical protein
MILAASRDFPPCHESAGLSFMMPTIIRVIAGHRGSSCKCAAFEHQQASSVCSPGLPKALALGTQWIPLGHPRELTLHELYRNSMGTRATYARPSRTGFFTEEPTPAPSP